MNQSTPAVVVTGAGGSIGASIGERVLDSGWRLVAVDLADSLNARWPSSHVRRQSTHASPQDSPDVRLVPLDLSDPTSASTLGSLLAAEQIPVAGLVHAAGSLRNGHVGDLSDDDWDNVLEVHLHAAFRLVRAALPAMTSHASVVLISSTSVRGSRFMANYSAAKAGMLGLTRAMAIELGRSHGTRVNCVLPGPIDTPMLHTGPEAWVEKVTGKVPLGRLGSPEDVARLVGFLLSQDSAYINGADIVIDGGLTLGG